MGQILQAQDETLDRDETVLSMLRHCCDKKCLSAVVDIEQFQTVGLPGIKGSLFVFFSCSEAEQGEVGTTITIGPSMSIIVCMSLASPNQVGERKWQILQVLREN